MTPDESSQSRGHETFEPAIEIASVAFRSGTHGATAWSRLRWLVWGSGVVLFALLAAAAGFVFTARHMVIDIAPEPLRVSVRGGLFAPRLGSYYLLRPGDYTVRAFKPCYRPLEQRLTVTNDKRQVIRLALEKLPGRLTLHVHQAKQPSVVITGAQIVIDDEVVGSTPLQNLEVQPGPRRVAIRAERYQLWQTSVDIEGCGVSQPLEVGLVPSWSGIRIRSVPPGAQVQVDAKRVGKTPLELELLPGTYDLALSAKRYQTWRTRLQVEANQPRVLDQIRLLPADGTLALRSSPAGASVMVGERYAGKTPLNIPLRPDTTHVIRISKAGYEKTSREVTVAAAQSTPLAVELVPQNGVVRLVVEPADAELLIDGKSRGAVRGEVRLAAVAHQVEIKQKGYESYRTTITPRPGFPQEIRVALKKVQPVTQPPVIQAGNGYALKRIRPGTFVMGASRREQGRRSNETLRRVTLQRPFYIGVQEVTNKAFREFDATHNAGAFRQQSLNRDTLPVVQVTWKQAAGFANWLSAKDALAPVYVERGNELVAAAPVPTGYRLCTEAEWEYSARFKNHDTFLKYPWGETFPPTETAGNFADVSAKDLLANVLERYNDGYPVTAPPGTFPASVLGLYDMGGNVAEWCHDYYSIYPYAANKVYLDPIGPKQGTHHVVRGSSWQHASISALRLAHRDYSQTKRPDVGFRLCRYLDTGSEKQ